MNKHLLLALIAIPLIAGCDSNGSGSTQQANNEDSSVGTDIGPVSDSSDPNFSNVINTAPALTLEQIEIEWECDPLPGPFEVPNGTRLRLPIQLRHWEGQLLPRQSQLFRQHRQA